MKLAQGIRRFKVRRKGRRAEEGSCSLEELMGKLHGLAVDFLPLLAQEPSFQSQSHASDCQC